MHFKHKDKRGILNHISRYLMLYGSFINNPGLLHGKMGIAIFFYHLGRYMDNKIYYDFGGELIDEIYNDLTIQYPIRFDDGLCGIGWGIQHLIDQGFVKADPDEVLRELDLKILECDVRRLKDTSFETGLIGIAHYIISRYRIRTSEHPIITNDYITELKNAILLNTTDDLETKNLIQNLNYILSGNAPSVTNLIPILVTDVKYKQDILHHNNRVLGISNNGYAGIGLKILLDLKTENEKDIYH